MLATAPAPPPCVPAAAHVVLARGASAVFTTGSEYEACTGAHAPLILGSRLPTPGFFRRVSTFRLAGQKVAFVVNMDGPGRSPARIQVRDLASGALIADRRAALGSPPAQSSDEVTSLVARRDGALAWIVVTRSSGPSSTRRQVVEAHRHGHARLLDQGAGVATRSLRLHGHTLGWRHGGHVRHAPF